MTPPAAELTESLCNVQPGYALDLACGRGRHTVWLRDRGWQVTAVDIEVQAIDGVNFIRADLEAGGFSIEPGAWDLIVCWLYWQEDLLPAIARGVRPGGYVALAGKTTGRFATSLKRYQRDFAGWPALAAGQDGFKAFLVAQAPLPAMRDQTIASSG